MSVVTRFTHTPNNLKVKAKISEIKKDLKEYQIDAVKKNLSAAE